MYRPIESKLVGANQKLCIIFLVPDLEWACSRIYKGVPILLLNPRLKGLLLEQLQSRDNYALCRLCFNGTKFVFSSPGGILTRKQRTDDLSIILTKAKLIG